MAQALLIASNGSAIWKVTFLDGSGSRFKVQDYANRDTRREQPSEAVSGSGTDDRPAAQMMLLGARVSSDVNRLRRCRRFKIGIIGGIPSLRSLRCG
jgi:hypothetical protein